MKMEAENHQNTEEIRAIKVTGGRWGGAGDRSGGGGRGVGRPPIKFYG